MKVGNIMAENNSLMSLANAITPSASTNTGFDQYMHKSMGQQNDIAAKPVAKVKDGMIVSDTAKLNVAESSETANADMGMTDAARAGMQNTETEVSAEQLDAVNQQIKNVVADTMNLDEETVEAILAELGIVPLELLQPENLQQFVLLADGGQEATDLLLNEQMMTDFNMLSEMLQGLDFSEITDAPVNQLLQQMQLVMEPLPELPAESFTEIAGLMPAEQEISEATVSADVLSAPMDESTAVENQSVQTEPFAPMAEESSRTVLARETADGAVMRETEEQPQITVSVSQTETNAESRNSENGQQSTEEMWNEELPPRASEPQEQPADIPVLMNHFSQAVHAVNEANAPQPVTPQMVQIVEQIVEQIRVNLQSDTTSMEMQLNPESLGKVLLSVTAKAGVMTATFTVQTEEARAALESQMYTLRENLEQKELKVDAVEVTVSNFDFTQAGNGGEDQKNTDQGDGRSRRFRVEEQDDEESDELTAEQEAERVRQSVMRDNGGSIDFTA